MNTATAVLSGLGSNVLTEDEERQKLLVYHEDIAIAKLKRSAEDLAIALDHIATIKRDKLYRGAWSTYVKSRFGVTRQRIEQLVKHAQTLEVLTAAIGNSVAVWDKLPEGVTRPLNDVPDHLKPEVYEIAVNAAALDGKPLSSYYMKAAIETLDTFTHNKAIEASAEARESLADNISRHSHWELAETFQDDLSTILDTLAKRKLGKVKVLVYIPKIESKP